MPIHYPEHRPPFSWENIRVNDELGRVEGVITEGTVLAHAFAIGEDPQTYLQGFDGLGPFVPPSLLVNDLLKLFLIGYDCSILGSAAGLHTKAQIKIHAPIPIGSTVSITGRHIAKFIKGGRRSRSVASRVSANGVLLAEMLATETVGFGTDHGPDTEGEPANWAAALPRVSPVFPSAAPRATPGRPLSPGMALGPRRRWVGYEQSLLFSGFPYGWAQERPELRQGLHTNYEVAQRGGYPAPIAQGLLSAGHLSALLLEQVGKDYFNGTELALNFVAPVVVGTTLISHAVVQPARVEDGGAQLLSLVTVDAEGSVKTAGYARLPRGA